MTVKQLKEKLANAPDDMKVTIIVNEDGELARAVFFHSVENLGNGDGESPENAKRVYYGADNPITAYRLPKVVLAISN